MQLLPVHMQLLSMQLVWKWQMLAVTPLTSAFSVVNSL